MLHIHNLEEESSLHILTVYESGNVRLTEV